MTAWLQALRAVVNVTAKCSKESYCSDVLYVSERASERGLDSFSFSSPLRPTNWFGTEADLLLLNLLFRTVFLHTYLTCYQRVHGRFC